MNPMPQLRTALLDVLHELPAAEMKLIIGGGYGIYLKREYLRVTGTRTLLRELPEARSTNDLDLILRPELLIESGQLKPLAARLNQLGYQPVQGAEKYQFALPGPTGGRDGSLKIDLLTGPRTCFDGTRAKVDDRRISPRPSVGLHAHHIDEALTLEEELLPITLQGTTSQGEPTTAVIYIPHALTFAMMKLYAFRDRFGDPEKEFGSYHALDLYAVIAMATEPEWNSGLELSQRHAGEPVMREAAEIVDQYFSTRTSRGLLRLQESPYYRGRLQIDEFREALQELFPKSRTSGAT